MLAAAERLTRVGSTYRRQADELRDSSEHLSTKVLLLAGVLQALRADFDAGSLRSVEELIHANVFADFLEMADELQTKDFKDPAAVLAGSVLEEHLRKLAVASGLTIEVNVNRRRPTRSTPSSRRRRSTTSFNRSPSWPGWTSATRLRTGCTASTTPVRWRASSATCAASWSATRPDTAYSAMPRNAASELGTATAPAGCAARAGPPNVVDAPGGVL